MLMFKHWQEMKHDTRMCTLGTTATISPALSWRAFSSALVKSASTRAYSNWPALASTMNWLTRSLTNQRGIKILLTNERRVLPDGGRLGCADHYSAPSLECDLEAVSLDGAHLPNVLKTEEVHNLQSVITMSLDVLNEEWYYVTFITINKRNEQYKFQMPGLHLSGH